MNPKIPLTLACLLCFSMAQAENDFNINADSIRIPTDGVYWISGSGMATTVNIKVDSGVVANVTLHNVNIDVSGIANACAFDILPGPNVTLRLSSVNTLKSSGSSAGLQVNEGATLVIEDVSNSNQITVYGGAKAAGNITINGGEITAICASTDWGAAAIGGGSDYDNNTYDGGEAGCITINGGNVTAQGGRGCAGVSSRYTPKNWNSNGIITITGHDQRNRWHSGSRYRWRNQR